MNRLSNPSLKVAKIYSLQPVGYVEVKPEMRGFRLIWQRLAQSFRLMVGVPDYDQYLEHMKKTHPEAEPMDAKAFYRRSVDARYPSKGGRLNKCPC